MNYFWAEAHDGWIVVSVSKSTGYARVMARCHAKDDAELLVKALIVLTKKI